jgi:hypothetical protein
MVAICFYTSDSYAELKKIADDKSTLCDTYADWGIAFELGFEQIILLGFITSLIATVTELISTKGSDDLTVPLITVACLLFLRSH